MRQVCSLLFFCLISLGVAAQDNASSQQCAPDGIAVGGFDLVSYHQASGPLPGDTGFAHQIGELTYLFSSADNLQTFLSDQQRYLPTYQGFCAATLAMGRLACPDYSNFKIENGRLLLFELAGFTNGRSLWNSDPVGFRQRADANFQTLVK